MIGGNARAVLVAVGTFLTASFASMMLLAAAGGAGAIEAAIVLMLAIVIGVVAGIVSQRHGRRDES